MSTSTVYVVVLKSDSFVWGIRWSKLSAEKLVRDICIYWRGDCSFEDFDIQEFDIPEEKQ